jgi:putative transposase
MKVIKQTDFSNENKADWIKVFNDLIDRGLKRVMLIVSDDFLGI